MDLSRKSGLDDNSNSDELSVVIETQLINEMRTGTTKMKLLLDNFLVVTV
jgi:hypothetical protein